MRSILAGLLLLAIPTVALAQVKGQVLEIGFNNWIRPDCWTPMLVQLTSQSPDSTDYQIQIAQEDLDRDQVIFPQHVSLGGVVEGHAAPTENFWVYFRPKPTEGGLPDGAAGATIGETNKALKVYLCTKDGKQISVIPNTTSIDNVDPKRSQGDESRSRKFVLAVTDGVDRPTIPFGPDRKARGILEDAVVETVHPSDLPSNVIGYDAIDAIVWMDADANALTGGTRTPELEAIRQYVRQGGHLIVCEPAESFKVRPFADMLPVQSNIAGDWKLDTVDCKDEQAGNGPIDILRKWSWDNSDPDVRPNWGPIRGTFKVARAVPTGDAKVLEWMTWQGESSTFHTPWLARKSVGLGAVTWVAQDLGSPALTEYAKTGWQFIWNRVFDWNNPSIVHRATERDDEWRPASEIDLGVPLIKGMDLTSKATWLVSLACLFFVVYWIVAGPGVYFYLVAKKRAQFSWFYFAASALVATAVTVLLVKLVVRGPPELRHLSDIRYAAGEETGIIRSRFGLYIPQDGDKTIDVKGTADHAVSYIAPFAINPQFVSSDDTFPAYLNYQIPVRDPNDTTPLSVTIPYRSTSKKLEVQWIGEVKDKVEIKPGTSLALNDSGYLEGTLVNHSGSDLADVYFAFKCPMPGMNAADSVDETDYVVFDPQWPKDAELSFKDLMKPENRINLSDTNKRQPIGDKPSFGWLATGRDWDSFWSEDLGEHVADGQNHNTYLAMLTFFDRIPPWQIHGQTTSTKPRFELFRRNARFMNLSPAESAGSLVMVGVTAQNNFGDDTHAQLPIPLNVSDSPVSGDGTTMVQFVFPIDRSKAYREPATRPSSTPTSQPSK